MADRPFNTHSDIHAMLRDAMSDLNDNSDTTAPDNILTRASSSAGNTREPRPRDPSEQYDPTRSKPNRRSTRLKKAGTDATPNTVVDDSTILTSEKNASKKGSTRNTTVHSTHPPNLPIYSSTDLRSTIAAKDGPQPRGPISRNGKRLKDTDSKHDLAAWPDKQYTRERGVDGRLWQVLASLGWFFRWLAGWTWWTVSWLFIVIFTIWTVILSVAFCVSLVWWTSRTAMHLAGRLVCYMPPIGVVLNWTGLACTAGSSNTSNWTAWHDGGSIVCNMPWLSTQLQSYGIACSDMGASPATTVRHDMRRDIAKFHKDLLKLNHSTIDLVPQANLLLSAQLDVFNALFDLRSLETPQKLQTVELYKSLGYSLKDAGFCAGDMVFNISSFISTTARNLQYLERRTQEYNERNFFIRFFLTHPHKELSQPLGTYLRKVGNRLFDLERQSQRCFTTFQTVETRIDEVQTQQAENVQILKENLEAWWTPRRSGKKEALAKFEHEGRMDHKFDMQRISTLASELTQLRKLSSRIQYISKEFLDMYLSEFVLHEDMSQMTADLLKTSATIQKATDGQTILMTQPPKA